jgi:hypothetical protein
MGSARILRQRRFKLLAAAFAGGTRRVPSAIHPMTRKASCHLRLGIVSS